MYNLEDFETWLQEQATRRENIPQPDWNKQFYNFKVHQNFTAFLEGREEFATEAWQPYRQAVLKWKSEIDNGNWNSENSAIAKLKKEKQDLQARIRLKSEQEAETLHELDNLQLRLTDRIQALEREQAKNQALEQQLQAKENQINELTEAKQVTQTAYEAVFEEVQELRDKARMVERLQTELANSKNTLTQTQELNQKLQQDNKDLLKDIHNYKQKITNLEQTITTLKNQVQTQSQTITQTNQALTQQKSRWTQHIQQTKSQLQQEITLIKEVLHV